MGRRVGFLTLRPLYELIRRNRRDYEKALNLRTTLGGEFTKRCKSITEDIPAVQGIYVWGKFDTKKYWSSLYLGKAGLGKTKKLLRARITEELKDERCSLWRHVLTEAELLQAGPRVHVNPEQWDRYIKKAWQRSFRKSGVTHIIWVTTAALDNKNVLAVEAELIEALNPRANILRPVPPRQMVREASRIFTNLRDAIHQIRRLSDEKGPFRLK